MSVEVYLPPSLQSLAGDLRPVAVEGRSVAACLDNLCRRYPDLKAALFPFGAGLNPRLSFYLNQDNLFPDVLIKSLQDGDKLYIIDILAGG